MELKILSVTYDFWHLNDYVDFWTGTQQVEIRNNTFNCKKNSLKSINILMAVEEKVTVFIFLWEISIKKIYLLLWSQILTFRHFQINLNIIKFLSGFQDQICGWRRGVRAKLASLSFSVKTNDHVFSCKCLIPKTRISLRPVSVHRVRGGHRRTDVTSPQSKTCLWMKRSFL